MHCNSHSAPQDRERSLPRPRLVHDGTTSVASPAKRILVVEDHVNLANLVRMHLEREGLGVVIAHDGNNGYMLAASDKFDLIVLDLALPGMDGLSICSKLRREGITTPILILSARYTEADRVAGLDAGADDYVSKPFGISEFLARIRVQLRRDNQDGERSTVSASGTILSYDDLLIVEENRSVTVAGKPVSLTATEFDLLWILARSPGRVFTRSQLLDLVWSQDYSGLDNTVKSHINRLRSKIEPDPAHPRYIMTVWGIGYRFGSEGGR